jgi:hypothetical protein
MSLLKFLDSLLLLAKVLAHDVCTWFCNLFCLVWFSNCLLVMLLFLAFELRLILSLHFQFYCSGAIHLMSSNNDAVVRVFDCNTFSVLGCFQYDWPVNVGWTPTSGLFISVWNFLSYSIYWKWIITVFHLQCSQLWSSWDKKCHCLSICWTGDSAKMWYKLVWAGHYVENSDGCGASVTTTCRIHISLIIYIARHVMWGFFKW